MNTWDFPQVGSRWVSNLFYFLLKLFIRSVEIFYGLIDAVFGGMV